MILLIAINIYSLFLICLDETYLLAVPEDLVVLSPNEFENVIIPCRPTSPGVNVTLLKDEEDVNNYRF